MMWSYSIDRPRRTIFAGVLLVLAISPGLLHLRLRTDGNALVPPDSPDVLFDAEFRSDWSQEDHSVVVIDTDRPDGIYNVQVLALLRDLTTSLGQLDTGADAVTSLATEMSDRVHGGTLDFRPILDPFPRTPEELDQLKKVLDAYKVYHGTLISHDASALAILIPTPREIDRSAFHMSVERIIRGFRTLSARLYVAGPPIAESQLGSHILDDLLGTRLLRRAASLGLVQPAGDAFADDAPIRMSMVLVSLAAMAGVFFVAFRRAVAVLLPLGEVAACMVFTFALMGWFDVPVYLTTAVVPVLLTAIGVADELHVFTRYRQALWDNPSATSRDAVTQAMGDMWRPITKTAITSAVGFASFLFSQIMPVRMFGLFMAVGIVFCWMWSLTVIPACLVLVNPSRFRSSRSYNGGALPALARGLVRRVIEHRIAVLLATMAVVLAAPPAIRRVIVQDSWVDAFSPASPLRRALDEVNRDFFGAHLLKIEFDSGPVRLSGAVTPADIAPEGLLLDRHLVDQPGHLLHQRLEIAAVARPPAPADAAHDHPLPEPIRISLQSEITEVSERNGRVLVRLAPDDRSLLFTMREWNPTEWNYAVSPAAARLLDPAMVDAVGQLESFIESKNELTVGGVQGYREHLATTYCLLHARNEDFRITPPSPRDVDECLTRYRNVRGQRRLDQLVDSDRRRCTITVFLKDANFVAVRRLLQDIREYERRDLTPLGVRLRFAGDVAVSQSMIAAIVSTQTISLVSSLGTVLLVTAILSRSISWGLLCVVPAGLAVLANFAVMGAVGIPLGVATSMFSGMTIGVGVDFAIHLLERTRKLTLAGCPLDQALVEAAANTAPPIVIDAVSIAVGFGVLMLSQVPANQRLGALTLVAVLACLGATFLVLPAIVRVTAPGFLTPSPGSARPASP